MGGFVGIPAEAAKAAPPAGAGADAGWAVVEPDALQPLCQLPGVGDVTLP